MGYCPQVDPLLELMTGRETLELFGRLKGIPSKELISIVSDILFRVGLTVFADKVPTVIPTSKMNMNIHI